MMSEHNPSEDNNLILYHPLCVLQVRVEQAYELAEGAIGNCLGGHEYAVYQEIYNIPTQRAINLAHSSAIGSALWLEHGLGDEAGMFETDLRAVLYDLRYSYCWFRHNITLQDSQKILWEQYIGKLLPLYERIGHIAEIDKDMIVWFKFLNQCYRSLCVVHEELIQLNKAVKNGVKSQTNIHYLNIQKALPDFNKSLSVIKHGLLFSRERTYGYYDEDYQVLLERLPELLYDRIHQIVRYNKTQGVEKNNSKSSKACIHAGMLIQLLAQAVEVGKKTINNDIHNYEPKSLKTIEDASNMHANPRPASADSVSDDIMMTPNLIMNHFNIPKNKLGALRKALERYRIKDRAGNGWREIKEVGHKREKFEYRIGSVTNIINVYQS